MLACLAKSKETVKFLLEVPYFSLPSLQCQNGAHTVLWKPGPQTALHIAAEAGSVECLILLLENHAKLNAENANGEMVRPFLFSLI